VDVAVPIATYRVQLHAGFTFKHAAEIAPYLAALGISHIYCSPYLQATKGSRHGYDVVDHRWVNRELGGEEGFAEFIGALETHELAQVVDVVPNHMAIAASENRWWHDVLENGPSSYFASYFDVEWEPPEARLRNTVLIPILRDHYGRVLEAGEIVLGRDGATFSVRYLDYGFPVDPRALGPVLGKAAQKAASDELSFLADAFSSLPRPTAIDRASVKRRHRDKEVLRRQLERWLTDDPRSAAAVDEAVSQLNGDPNLLHELLEAQNYRLAWWKSAGRDLGYRRFFDINTLIALRMEDDQVFDDTHARILEWVHEGLIDGLRVDHPDGLRDPQGYLDRLRRAAPDAWIVVEKVLEDHERLPETWPVAGTTGYDFLNRVGGLFLDQSGERALTAFYGEFTHASTDYERVVREKKSYALREILGSDVNRLTDLLIDICERQRRHRDYSRHQLADALREVIVALPVYRTYVQPTTGLVTDADREHIVHAIEAATRERPDIEASLFEFLSSLLLLDVRGALEGEFVARFQQLTGPVMAKGVEDTAFYVYNRFIALNEVGGDPSRFSMTIAEFHEAAREAQTRRPLAMLTLTTHDTKRSEDVRARLALITERPGAWITAVQRWSGMLEEYRTNDWPDRNTEYYFYQTLVGAWPISVDRVLIHMEKATREAKTHTSWTTPNIPYEDAVKRFVTAAFDDGPFMRDLSRYVEPLIDLGRITSLAQTLIKLTAPGIPDFYQGTELWSLQLVDPDNRGDVDYAVRRRALAAIETLTARAIWERSAEGLPKLWTIRQALQLRRRHPELFGPAGAYQPLRAEGHRAEHVVAFQRGADVITIVPRLVLGACGRWHQTTLTLPSGHWRNVLTGLPASGVTDLEALWGEFPVALLERDPASNSVVQQPV
jgi:(1->4)-alpha-D-glucan 1-alpha-D-glucosylmutase